MERAGWEIRMDEEGNIERIEDSKEQSKAQALEVMASISADMNALKLRSQKVRIIAIILGDAEYSISVYKFDDKVAVCFGEQPSFLKNCYDLDYCYGPNEGLDSIFDKEVKPLISEIFSGKNASVVGYGARGSGKTCTIQGCVDKPGLAALAVSEILSMAGSVMVSMYEIYHENLFDLLDSKKKVQPYEISQVPINSISEFEKLYYSIDTSKAKEKVAPKIARRSHKGLMIRVLSDSGNSGKMNFIDLAGYEDPRRNSSAETANINKSLYGLLNVVYAINSNESRVPYRDSKLTHLLQDSFGGSSRVLLLTCLNPTCQDTMHTVSSASRSFQGNKGVSQSSVKRRKVPMCQHTYKVSSPSRSLQGNEGISNIEEYIADASFSQVASFQERPLQGNIEASVVGSSIHEENSPPLSSQLRELSYNLKSLCDSTPAPPFTRVPPFTRAGLRETLIKDCLQFINFASKDELKELKGIGEKRADFILELRAECPEPFKTLDDLQSIGLSEKQVKILIRDVAGLN